MGYLDYALGGRPTVHYKVVKGYKPKTSFDPKGFNKKLSDVLEPLSSVRLPVRTPKPTPRRSERISKRSRQSTAVSTSFRRAAAPTQTMRQQKRRRMNSTKFAGNYQYVGPFRRPGRRHAPSHSFTGAILKTDNGGKAEGTSDKTLYFGHTNAPPEHLLTIVCMALIRKLAKKMGIDFTAFDKEVYRMWGSSSYTANGTIFLDYTYRTATTMVGDDTSFAVGGNATWQNLADTLKTTIVNTMATIDADFIHSFRLKNIWWRGDDTAASSSQITTPFARMQVENSVVSLTMNSTLCIQNRTPAEADATGHGHETHDHIENNPLKGRVYQVNGINGFRLKATSDASTSFLLTADKTTGIIQGNSDDASLTSNMQSRLSRAPLASHFSRCNQSAPIRLGPGKIKKSYLKSGATIGLNGFLQKMRPNIQTAANTKPYCWLGKARLFALEKMLHVDANDPNIFIGYEQHNYFSASIKLKGVPVSSAVTTSALVSYAAPAD